MQARVGERARKAQEKGSKDKKQGSKSSEEGDSKKSCDKKRTRNLKQHSHQGDGSATGNTISISGLLNAIDGVAPRKAES